ncbi:hypothetical protein BC834DRAFT_591853 [Gloeopeniophorella convolvens]|nr:hypothetical protein BC834DRAFT_591853 [Gloeopeniophorella convolvens]
MTEPQTTTALTSAAQPFGYHEMRITQGGKIRAWVDFALKFFEENEDKALVLHTLPAAKDKKPSTDSPMEVEPQDTPQPAQEPSAATEGKKKGISPSTVTIPRLISVVEIIKREYLRAMHARRAPELVGLYQYNEIGCLKEEGAATVGGQEGAEDRAKMLTDALSGNNVEIKKSPYMKVTLCRKELPALASRGATVQGPLKRKLSKSARGRLKKRQQKERVTGDQSENGIGRE